MLRLSDKKGSLFNLQVDLAVWAKAEDAKVLRIFNS